ncbi:hypothetical protein [Herpetosiphon geysericola]|nr:hypothetical protein [Herpetosiphon geysericola]
MDLAEAIIAGLEHIVVKLLIGMCCWLLVACSYIAWLLINW